MSRRKKLGLRPTPTLKSRLQEDPAQGRLPVGISALGKELTSLAMANAVEHFTALGYRVLVVPETATLTMLAGGNVVVVNMKTKDAVKRGVAIHFEAANLLDPIHQDAEVFGELLQLACQDRDQWQEDDDSLR